MFGSSVTRSSRTLQIATLAGGTLAMSLGTFSAHGAILNWASAVSGTASTAARWNPAVVPTAADDLVFNATAGAQAYSVTFDATTATSRTMEFNQDTVTLTMSSPHTTTNGFTIADGATDVAVVTLASGTWTSALSSATAFDIGNVSGSVGTLNVTDDSADLILTGAGSRIRVGNNGSGTLSITGGGRVEVGAVILASAVAASNGTLTISGAQAVSPFQRSTLVCTNASDVCSLGSGNDATTTISNGAIATLAGDLEVARSNTSTSTLTVGGAGGIGNIHDATLNVAGNSFVGGNGSATLVGGIGTVTVNNNGQFLTGGTLHVGNDPNGGTGTLTINTGSLVSATNVIDGTAGTINHTGGTLHINGGTYTGHPAPLVVSGTGSPTLRYSGNSVNNLTAAGGVGLKVGDDLGAGTFTGNLIIDSGADVVMSGASNDINIGDDAGTTGDVTVTGTGSRLVADQPGDLIRVGFNGTGELIIENGGQVLATEVQIPASSLSGNGTLFMSGIGSSITTSNLSVGNAAGLGNGSITVNPQCTITATNPGVGVVIRDTGTTTVTADANLNATGTILIDGGTLTVGGTVAAGTLVDVDAGGLLRSNISNTGTPLVDGPVHVRTGGVVEAIFEDLTIGDIADVNGVILDSGSIVTVGTARTLTLLDSNTINAQGDIVMQGGTIVCPPVAILNNAGTTGNSFGGFGTIDANMQWGRPLTPSGSGLVFLGNVFMNGGFSASGTTMRFASGSLLTDLSTPALVLSCKVIADEGSVIRPNAGNTFAFGPATMGDGTTTGVTLNGVLHMGTDGSLTFNDLNGVGLGTLTDMNGGIITSVNGLSVGDGRVLRGRGSLNVNNPGGNGFTLITGGTIDPDAYFSATDTYHGIAQFSIDGRYVQQANATYLCELAGFNNEFQPLNDKIVCGPAVLAGTLDVSLIDGYEPRLCDEFTIMQYTSRTGTWTNIVSPPGVGVGVRYEATRAVLFFNSLECNDIDFNNDGSIFDPQDIDAFLSVYSEGPCIPVEATCDDIDFNNDCSVFDPQDIDAFLSVFSEGPCIH